MEKIWLKNYPAGVPNEINPDVYTSLVDLFEQSCKAHAERPAFYNLGKTISYHELDQLSIQFAAYLQHDLGVKKGDRVAIMMPNCLQYPIAMFGAMRAGAAIVNVNPLYTADELSHQLNDAGADVVVVLANFAKTVETALPRMPGVRHVIVTQIGDMLAPLKGMLINFILKYVSRKVPSFHLPKAILFRKALQQGKQYTLQPVALSNQDTAFLQYTGGTTGVSKGAVLTHRNILANVQQANAWVKDLLTSKNEIIITALPLYHIFSLTANCIYFTHLGGLNVLITNPRDIPGLIHEIKKFKFTAITGVNTLFNAMLRHPQFSTIDFSSLHLTLGGGMAVQRVVAEKWQATTKVPLLEAYGLTETSPCVTINPIDLKAYNGSIGLPVPSTDITVLDEQGQEVEIGQPGELAVKGPQVMKGYWNKPDETAKVFTKDGWLLTGDIVTIDDQGYVRLLERKKDMIVVSGFNVYPNEVEDVLAKLPGVHEVAVVGVPDQYSGEVPKAFIVKDNPALTAQDVLSHAREHLTGYKIPKSVEFVDEIPKTNVGKILRRALRGRKS